MALQQRPPQHITRIQWPVGKFLVIEIYAKATNETLLYELEGSSFGAVKSGKVMPFLSGEPRNKKPDDLDLKNDILLGSEYWQDTAGAVDGGGDSILERRELIFINVALAEKATDDLHVEYDILLKGLGDPTSDPTNIGYYAWSSLAYEVPPSNGDEAFQVHTFVEPAMTFDQVWISRYNPPGPLALAQLWAGSSGAPYPASQSGAYGWRSADEQTQALATLNSYLSWDHAHSGDPGPLEQFFAVTINFGSDPSKQHKVEYQIRAGFYVGRLNFPYDAQKNPLFPAADQDTAAEDKDKRIALYSETKTRPSSSTLLKIKLLKGVVSIEG